MTSVVLIAIGIIMLIWPASGVDTLIAILGYVILIIAAVTILDFLGSNKGLMDYVSLAVGLVFLIAGVAVLVFYNDMLTVISLVFGIILILGGAGSILNTVIFVRRSGHKGWVILLILSILLVLAGVMVLVNPWWATTAELMRIIGWAMLFSAVVSIVQVILIWPFRTE